MRFVSVTALIPACGTARNCCWRAGSTSSTRRSFAGLSGSAPAAVIEVIRLDFVLPAGAKSFMRELRQNLIRECATREDVRLRLCDMEGPDQGTVDQHPRVEAVRMLTSTVRGRIGPEYLPRAQIILRENSPTD